MKILTIQLSLFFICLVLGPKFSFAGDSAFSASFGPVQVGGSRIVLDLNDFKVENELKSPYVKSNFIKGSVQWVRNSSNLLTPRARLAVHILKKKYNIHLEYLGRNVIPQKKGNYLYTEIFVNLFSPGVLKIVQSNTVLEKINVFSEIIDKKKKTKLIDYSCVRYGLSIEGLDDVYMSVGCRLERVGTWGYEKPFLEVTLSATNIHLINGKRPPFTTFIKGNEPVGLTVIDQEGKQKSVFIKAKLPKRLHRLNTAFGFGPAGLLGHSPGIKKDWKAAPVLYLYGKLDLNRHSSIRVFDALAYNKTIFNNSGLYFAYQLADAMDGRLEIVPLLGAQGLYFKQGTGSGKAQNEFIFPQGAEINYKNAFGIENYLVSFGIFLSTQSSVDYTNAWVRWGKGPFWEFNYITWAQNGYVSKMAGLSIGLPLMSFF
jgi:hypothetical protein